MSIKLIKRIKFMMKRWEHNDEMFSRAMGHPSRRERMRRAQYLTALNIELTWQEEMCAMNCDCPPSPLMSRSVMPDVKNAVQKARDFCRRLDEKIEKHCRTHGLKFEPLWPELYSPSPVPPSPPPPPPPSPEENLRAMVKTLGEIRDILASRELY